ncbi:TPA: SET domain-containing protein-lysine N-methyltransferase [Burkholderia cepacia]|uniref:SET domain-containing protein-lysine N-methyltransferase n=3 Tax=Burkholderia cepacia complex TaxID=87882 RepID=A0A6P3BUU4_9BURK|nr:MULTISPECIES: SET domain-containing protein-lysine N-methyltransferase [Burkholderia]HDR9760285.1 SET domain-containing protein-lysine N-methyltransferase [Burkholderia cepacia ATCC 25416]KKL36363.1 nuclear protein SET [Burkholderia contaminans LMG 23361]MBA9834848.1 SET domain-containing protein-lysine N-methyltransferase [Burkholderia contaminans]MBA9842684.1 SET domain-containing protein-lysine N-methyltransferase [Burkholderia contaminans]MBA9867449.1 SET domain-containing protein-lysin
MKRFSVRRSPVHGKGVFALLPLQVGEVLVEYKGKRMPWQQAVEAHEAAGMDGHTFFFGLSDGGVIDGGQGGNSARWLNHACDANCEAVEVGGRVYIEVVRKIECGDELFIDYGLQVDEPSDQITRDAYKCNCGARSCRGTMLGDV